MFLMYNDQHRHYQISFLFWTPHARAWDDSHVRGSCHRGSIAARLALSVRQYKYQRSHDSGTSPRVNFRVAPAEALCWGRLVTKPPGQAFVGEMAKETEAGGMPSHEQRQDRHKTGALGK